MLRMKYFINNLSKLQKTILLILTVIFVLFLTIGIPTLARLKNRTTLATATVWDGSLATSYKKGDGSINDPYVISDGSELAYFYEQLSSNDYENTYFKLSNDILLNGGYFIYDSVDGIQYVLNNETYYIKPYSNKYYEDVLFEQEAGTVNLFNPLDGFKGYFDGSSYRIYGLYMTSENNVELGLFKDLKGSVHDLYVENALIYGGNYTAGIASSTNNADLKNILFNGNVVGKKDETTSNVNAVITSSIMEVQNEETTNYISLKNKIPFVGGTNISTSITGNYTVNGASESETTILINGHEITNGSFNINLGSGLLNDVSVVTSTTSSNDVTLSFSNLSYNITYDYGVSAGIVSKADNTVIENAVNKGYVYGSSVSGGLVGVNLNALSIKHSYNVGKIESLYSAGGLVGSIEKSSIGITIDKCYNNATLESSNNGGLVGIIKDNTNQITISNSFDMIDDYSIDTISNTTVNIDNTYYIKSSDAVRSGTTNGSFINTTTSNLKAKSYVSSNLLFDEFVSFNDLSLNENNVWIYEKNSLPILFIDDINEPIANIHASIHSWNNLSFDLNSVRLSSNITFSIEQADPLVPIKEQYYYISDSSTPLTKEEINGIEGWTSYSNIVQISQEGVYVIYAKIVDYDDVVTYINTDVLILDLPGVNATVDLNNHQWTDLRSSLEHIYIDKEEKVTVDTLDNISGVSSIKYYISNALLSSDDLDQIEENNWNIYDNEIVVNEVGEYIIYVKITDSFDYVTYINTDYICLNGYTLNNLIVGRNSTSYSTSNLNITDKSTISLNVSYENATDELTGYSHNLITNILLPFGTKITMVDNIRKKVYEYQITTYSDIFGYNDSCSSADCTKVATYPFSLFKEIGTLNKPYVEDSYYTEGIVNEDFTFVIDFSQTNISSNYNDVSLYVELHDLNGDNVRPTLVDSIKKINIYSIVNGEDTDADFALNTDYNGSGIEYNSDSTTNINISSAINYKTINGNDIVDTTFEDKEVGLSIKLVDVHGNIIDKSHLKNIIFRVGENIFYPEEDNIVRIKLNEGIKATTKSLTITTYKNNDNLKNGEYFFKISNYASYDGYYYDSLSNQEISIPVNVSDKDININYNFDAIMDDSNRIISKNEDTVKVSFNVLQAGSLSNPNIRVSLYQKNQLTAYNQEYSLIDLAQYVSNNLNAYASNIYYVSTNPLDYDGSETTYNKFELNLITDNFQNNGYKYVFELYDGLKKIGTVEKYFIVK